MRRLETRRRDLDDPRPAPADGRPRPPRRRVEQGRGHHGALRPRGRRGPGRHLHRRRARRHPEPGAQGRPGGPGRHGRGAPPRDGARPRDPRRPARLARLRRLRASPRATRCRRCPRAASRCSRSSRSRRAARADHPRVPAARRSRPTTRTAATRTPTTSGPTRSRSRRSRRRPTPTATPAAGEPWQPLKLYYHLAFHKPRIVALHDAAVAAGMDPPFAEWLAEWEDEPERRRPPHDPGRVRRLLRRARRARCAPTRTPGRPRRPLVLDPAAAAAQAWPTEDFELAQSLVDTDAPRGRPLRRHPGAGPRLRDGALTPCRSSRPSEGGSPRASRVS